MLITPSEDWTKYYVPDVVQSYEMTDQSIRNRRVTEARPRVHDKLEVRCQYEDILILF
jgi:hypothetical protein